MTEIRVVDPAGRSSNFLVEDLIEIFFADCTYEL